MIQTPRLAYHALLGSVDELHKKVPDDMILLVATGHVQVEMEITEHIVADDDSPTAFSGIGFCKLTHISFVIIRFTALILAYFLNSY